MPNVLTQILAVTNLAAGATLGITHGVAYANVAKIPDTVERDNPVFTIVSCTSTTLTVKNESAAVASGNFLLTYWHTFQREFGDNATQQLTPAPFIPGGSAGSSAVVGGSSLVLEFQPGGAQTGPVVFNSFSDLYARLVALRTAAGGGKYAIGYDSSLGAVTVPAGTYDLTNVDQLGLGDGPVAVTYADGTVFTGARSWQNLIVTNANATTSPISALPDGTQFFLRRTTLQTTTGVAVPFINFTITGTFTLWLEEGSAIGGAQTGRVIGITGAPAKAIKIVQDDSSNIVAGATTIVLGAGATIENTIPSMVKVPVGLATLSVASPVLLTPASFRPNPYLGGSAVAPVTVDFGQWVRTTVGQALPAISTAANNLRAPGVPVVITNTDPAGITVTPAVGDTINGFATWTVSAGRTLMFFSNGVSDWRVDTGEPTVPQILKSPHWDGADGTVAIANDIAHGFLLGFAARDIAAGETLKVNWRNVVAATVLVWGEVAIGVSSFIAGDTPFGITPIGFANAATPMVTVSTNFTTDVVTSFPVLKGQGLWGIFACNATTAPTVTSGPLDLTGSGMFGLNTTAGWRPSLQLNAQGVFAIDVATQIPKQAWSI